MPSDNIEKLPDWLEELKKQIPEDKHVCHHCGRCPHCGRRYNDYEPYYPWLYRPQPYAPSWYGNSSGTIWF